MTQARDILTTSGAALLALAVIAVVGFCCTSQTVKKLIEPQPQRDRIASTR